MRNKWLACDCVRAACGDCGRAPGVRRHERHGPAVRQAGRGQRRDDRRLHERRDDARGRRRRLRRTAAERADGRGEPAEPEQDDGGRERLLHDADERTRGPASTTSRTVARLDEQPAARLPDTTPRPKDAVAAPGPRAGRGRSGPGLGPSAMSITAGSPLTASSRRTRRSGWPATAGWQAPCPTTRGRRWWRVGRRARSSSGTSTTR